MEIKEIVESIVEELKSEIPNKKNNWDGDPDYLMVREMSTDYTGDIGELLLEKVFKKHGYEVEFARSETSIEKDYDIKIADYKIEVKTATIGKRNNNFQHDKFYEDRKYDIVVFIDITANSVFCCMGFKRNIIWENLHQRTINKKPTEEFKFDFSLNAYKNNKITTNKKTSKVKEKLLDPKMGEIKQDTDLIDLFESLIKDKD